MKSDLDAKLMIAKTFKKHYSESLKEYPKWVYTKDIKEKGNNNLKLFDSLYKEIIYNVYYIYHYFKLMHKDYLDELKGISIANANYKELITKPKKEKLSELTKKMKILSEISAQFSIPNYFCDSINFFGVKNEVEGINWELFLDENDLETYIKYLDSESKLTKSYETLISIYEKKFDKLRVKRKFILSKKNKSVIDIEIATLKDKINLNKELLKKSVDSKIVVENYNKLYEKNKKEILSCVQTFLEYKKEMEKEEKLKKEFELAQEKTDSELYEVVFLNMIKKNIINEYVLDQIFKYMDYIEEKYRQECYEFVEPQLKKQEDFFSFLSITSWFIEYIGQIDKTFNNNDSSLEENKIKIKKGF